MVPLAVLLWLGAAASAGAPDEGAARRDLLAGVEALAAPGVPGDVVAFGPAAFVVLVDREGVPLAAAAEVGRGRVLVLGHDGYLTPKAAAQHDTGRFLENALRWLGGKRRPRVVNLAPRRAGALLEQLGFAAEEPVDPLEPLELDRADVVVLELGAPLTRARIEALRAFVADGGGLLGAATGWGWQSSRADQVLARDLPGNRLLEPFGLALGLRTITADEDGSIRVRASAALAHAGRALAALTADAASGDERRAAVARVAAAYDALEDHEPLLMRPLRALLAGTDAAGAGLRAELGAALRARELRPLGERWDEWLVLGPFAGSGRGPLEERLERFAADGPGPERSRTFRGRGGRVSWHPLEVPGDGRALDAGAVRLDGAALEGGAVYLARRVTLELPLERALEVETSGGLRLWIDGRLALERAAPARPGAQRADLQLRLAPGAHHLLVELTHGEGACGFRLRPLSGAPGAGAIDAAVGRGLEYLARQQLLDGSWAGYDGYGPGLTAWTLYALLKSGLDPADPTVQRARSFVAAGPAEYTYGLSAQLLAALAHERGAPGDDLRELTEDLIALQEPSGLFSYPEHPAGGRPPEDLSTTLFAALALRAAHERGLKVPQATWIGLLEGTLRCWRGDADDDPQRGFSYRAREQDARGIDTGAMTGAGLSVLAIAREGLGGRVDRRLAPKLAAAEQGARRWLEQRVVFDRNPGQEDWHFFHLYGLERTAELLGAEHLGGLDWYREGAQYLLERQGPDGSWLAADHGQAVRDTALALLFLNRATRPGSGPGRAPRGAQVSAEEGQAAALAVTGSGPFDLWIAGFGQGARAAHGWGPGRELRAERARYLARAEGAEGELELAAVAARADAPVQRFEARVELPRPGRYTVRAELELLTPPARAGEPPGRATLASGPLELFFEGDGDPAVLAYAREGRENLLRGQALACAASSRGGSPPGAAADGLQGSWWECAPGDPERRWSAELERAVSARRLLLSHAAPSRADPGRARVAEVEVWINGELLGRFPMDPDPRRKTPIELGDARRVKRLAIGLDPGASGADRRLGLAEVELLPR